MGINIPNYDATQNITNPIRTIGPANKWRQVALDTDFGTTARWLLVGSSGLVSYVAIDDTLVSNFPVGDGYHFMLFKRINTTGTTATSLWWSD